MMAAARGVMPDPARAVTLRPVRERIGSALGAFPPPPPPTSTGGIATVRVSLNGQQFTTTSIPYSFHPLPIASRVSPTLGPPSGGTHVEVYANGLADGTNYLCRSGRLTSAVYATYEPEWSRLSCYSPFGAGGESVPLEVTTNGQDFSSIDANTPTWRTYTRLQVSGLLPSSGVFFGGTTVTIFGSGFERLAPGSCRFGLSALTSEYSYLNNTWSAAAFNTGGAIRVRA